MSPYIVCSPRTRFSAGRLSSASEVSINNQALIFTDIAVLWFIINS